MSKEKDFLLPEAFSGGVWEQDEDETLSDPYFRPDTLPEEEDTEPELPLDWLPEMPTEPCPCCGADIPENPSWGYICPVCLWEIDYDVQDDPDAPSDQNRGLSLTEARMNFHAFGVCDPWLVFDKNEEETP